jgi:GT2 family glycosyltransferase
MPRVSVNIVSWNSMAYLPELFASLASQTFTDFQVLLVDNASSDGVEAYVRANYPTVTLLRNARNLGFCAAHNQGIRFVLDRWSDEQRPTHYVAVVNPDTILSPTCLERLVAEADARPQDGSFGPKLLRAFGENLNDEVMKETVKSDIIDSTGLAARKNRTFADRGAGEFDKGQYDGAPEVFGVSGALALYRASALADANGDGEYFDADFFAYKDDVDLAWRLRLLGWGARFVPAAVAYHYRGMFGKEKMGFVERIRNRRGKSSTRSFYSTRNHWLMLVKDELVLNGLLASPRIVTHELLRVVYVFFFEPKNLRAFFAALFLLPKMWGKRRDTLRRRKATAGEMRAWFR